MHTPERHAKVAGVCRQAVRPEWNVGSAFRWHLTNLSLSRFHMPMTPGKSRESI